MYSLMYYMMPQKDVHRGPVPPTCIVYRVYSVAATMGSY